MEAKHLRIGNYISRLDLGNNEPRIERVIELHSDKVCTSGPIKVLCKYDEIRPIKLTEEWLFKFGFIFDVNGRYSKDGFSLGQIGTFFMFGKRHIQYVHTLQNLFFSLKDTELICQ